VSIARAKAALAALFGFPALRGPRYGVPIPFGHKPTGAAAAKRAAKRRRNIAARKGNRR
jgi:hypothetical protein